MKYLFVIADYRDYRQDIFNSIISPRNKKYCEIHDFKYVEIRREHNLQKYRDNMTWNKWKIISDLINANKLQDNDIIIQQDADVIPVDFSGSYEPSVEKSMTICIDSGNTFCHGIFGLRVNDWSRKLVSNILSDELYKSLQLEYSIHEGFPHLRPTTFISQFREQCVFYKLFGIKRHSNISFNDLPFNGINSHIDQYTIYDVDDFKKHVDILPVEYNVTIWPGESDEQFYINKLDNKETVKFRHFTGSDWNVVKNWIN